MKKIWAPNKDGELQRPPAAGVLQVAAVRRQHRVGLVGEEQRTMKSLCHLSGSMARRRDGKVM